MADSAKKIALIGGGGFLGSHLTAELIAETNDELTVVDPSLDKLAVAEQPRLRLVQSAIQQPGLVKELVDEHDVIVSLSALCNPALYNTRPLEVIDASFSDLVPLVQRCTEKGRWLVHVSTCEVYGTAVPDEALSEDDSSLTLGPVSKERWTYACAKQLLERVIWACGHHHSLAFTIVRPFNVIGPRMDYLPGIDGEGTPRVLACFMDALLHCRPLALVDGGRQRRSFIYVGDFVEAMRKLLARPDACRGEILNIGNPRNELSIAELADKMIDSYRGRGHAVAGKEVVAADRFYGEGYDDVDQRIPDIGKVRRLLDWEPRTQLAEMLPVIIDDYRRRYAQVDDSPSRG